MIDAFRMYTIKLCLLANPPGVFGPRIPRGLDHNTVTKIADGSRESVTERDDLRKKLKILEETMVTLRH